MKMRNGRFSLMAVIMVVFFWGGSVLADHNSPDNFGERDLWDHESGDRWDNDYRDDDHYNDGYDDRYDDRYNDHRGGYFRATCNASLVRRGRIIRRFQATGNGVSYVEAKRRACQSAFRQCRSSRMGGGHFGGGFDDRWDNPRHGGGQAVCRVERSL